MELLFEGLLLDECASFCKDDNAHFLGKDMEEGDRVSDALDISMQL